MSKKVSDRINKATQSLHLHGKKRRTPLFMMFCAFACISIIGACSSEKNIESIDIASSITMDIEEETNITFTTKPEDATLSNVHLKADEGIKATLDEREINVTSTTQEGTFQIAITNGDVESKLSIIVIDKAKEKAKKDAEAKAQQEAEEKVQQEAKEKAQQEEQAKAQREAEVQAQQEAEAATQYEQTESNQTPIGNQVYIAGSGNGKKYHNNPNCSNMSNPIQIQVDEALSRGYTACKKCY